MLAEALVRSRRGSPRRASSASSSSRRSRRWSASGPRSALNIPDFTRYAYSQRDQVVGQAIGLPPTMALFSFIGVAVTSATVVIFGETHLGSGRRHHPLREPGRARHRRSRPSASPTLATNIAANVVSPANDFANLWPTRISFRTGGFITGIIGILMQPWQLVADPTGYIFTWLVGYSALLGPLGGDPDRRRTSSSAGSTSTSPSSTSEKGPTGTRAGGTRSRSSRSSSASCANLPGFLGTIKVATVSKAWMDLYSYAWFVGLRHLVRRLRRPLADSPPGQARRDLTLIASRRGGRPRRPSTQHQRGQQRTPRLSRGARAEDTLCLGSAAGTSTARASPAGCVFCTRAFIIVINDETRRWQQRCCGSGPHRGRPVV